jgi:DnaK suppressor protein
MTSKQKEDLRTMIEKKLEETRSTIVELRESTKPMGLDSAIGRVSRMDYINNKSIAEGELQKAEDRVKALERWISLYDSDQFGKCSRCGQEINFNRLLLLPESTRCISCAGRS